MNITSSAIFLALFFLIELFYFRIADRYNIIDKPNFRSSHSKITIRGGGIIFTIAVLLHCFISDFSYPFFVLGLVIISSISFADDIKPISNRFRIICHFLAVSLLFYQVGLFKLPIYIVPVAFVMAIGIINAINFMDGINGLTGIYSFVTLLTLYYLDTNVTPDFVSKDLLITAILAVTVFMFFNLRTKAKSFAGDVGSVGIAFIIIFFMVSLIVASGKVTYLLLLLLYGLDAISTIVFRLVRRENIFKAHRSHFYQFLANEKRIPHPMVALGYAISQSIFNALLIILEPSLTWTIIGVVLLGLLFVALRFTLEGKRRLLLREKQPSKA
ncbi:UDP-GlcNAc--UDP-phosphate GlcNAc-1-phosphate transferase [Pedobacter psychrodurus]|uniref:UDP-GlcNAc--UDP-phosphate GlcNAc-1-phosphate transferase n=1 Tax=Pedobacter psychrodurus TaxID=2530456 RepID=UPI00292EEB57|nr:UDP-GlcNAc--UDP-phosphate GlcNAc-1-phosphate transferase [Pedobacter psychrodurus]